MNSIEKASPQQALSRLNEAYQGWCELGWIDEFVDAALVFQGNISKLMREVKELSTAFAQANPERSMYIKREFEDFAQTLEKLFHELSGGGYTTDHITDYVEGYDFEILKLAEKARCLTGKLSGKRRVGPRATSLSLGTDYVERN